MNPMRADMWIGSMEPMYNLAGRDPWSYYAVHANASRTAVTINQKARFGIGDIYYLAMYFKKLELIEMPTSIKRLSSHCVHLASGQKLKVDALLKLLGFW